MILLNIILLVFGMVLLIKGADFFVDGSSNIAKALKIPSLIIGLTLVSIGTSAPELSVSITSSLSGNNDLSFGNVVGSNIFNILMVVGICSTITPIIVSKEVQKIDIPILIGIYLILMIFGFIISPLSLERWESVIIMGLFVLYMVFLVIRGIKEAKNNVLEEEQEESKSSRLSLILGIIFGVLGVITLILQLIYLPDDVEIDYFLSMFITYFAFFVFSGFMVYNSLNIHKKEKKQSKSLFWIKNIFFVLIGVAGIIFGGNIVVDSASEIAILCGMDQMLIGLTIVAIGTSLPELVTSIVAAKKGENDIALGNAIGSCVFNTVLILGLASTIRPITLNWELLVDVIIMFASIIICLIASLKTRKINRIEGLIMVAVYIGYTAYIIARNYM